jgi:aspartate racemase
MTRRRIGVVGGVGPAATVLYYRLLIERASEIAPGSGPLEIVIDSLDFDEITGMFRDRAIDRLVPRLSRALVTLESAGCDSIVIACNSMHMAFSRAAPAVSIPVISIVDATLEATTRGGFRSVGLLATTFVTQSRLYRDPLEVRGVRCVEPSEADQEWIMAAIRDDLQHATVPAATIERFVAIVAELARRGAEAVILGCTDLPVAITDANSPLPVLDTARIHVDSVLAASPRGTGAPMLARLTEA